MKLFLTRTALAVALLMPPGAWSQVSVSINVAPPALPVYVQPPVPGEGYIWTPGYWAWSPRERDYFWIPGTWVQAPNRGDLWTPGYWAFENQGYFWHIGYWGPQVGFYGGINYGFGYFGSGYQGGRWDRGEFRYNRRVSNVDTRVVRHIYSAPPVRPGNSGHASFNGGKGGAPARPTNVERKFQAVEHPGPRADQMEHETQARDMPTQRATGPHGLPQVAATPRPSDFSAPNVERVRPRQAGPGQSKDKSARRSPKGRQDDKPDWER